MKTEAVSDFARITDNTNPVINIVTDGRIAGCDSISVSTIPGGNNSSTNSYSVPETVHRLMLINANDNRDQHEMVSPAYELEVIEDEDGFDDLAVEWDELLNNSSVNSLFLTWKWLRTWWRHLSEGRKLHVITVRRNCKLIAIAPLCIRPYRLGLLLPVRIFEFLGVGYVGSDYPDLIIRHGEDEPALQALLNHLVKHKLVLEFSQVLATSRYMSHFSSSIKQQGWDVSRKTTHVCPYITLSGFSWENYLGSLGPSHRYNFRRRLKNLQRDFSEVSFEQIRTKEQVDEILPRMIELHNRRWKERGGSDAFHKSGLLEFHEEISRITLEKDCLRLHVLRLNGKIAAILYGFKYDKVFYYYQSGFDIELSRYSVGLVIMGLAIKSAIEEGVDKYDFLHGDEKYKYLWATEQRELEKLILIPPTIAGNIYRHLISLQKLLKSSLRKLLPDPVMKWITSFK